MNKIEKNKQTRGITLIALVISIIVLLILAGVSIAALVRDDGLLTKAQKGAFVNEMKQYEEEIKLHITGQQIGDKGYKTINISVGLPEEGQEDIKTILPQIKETYKDQVIAQSNKMYYKYNGTSESKKRVKWCFESNIPVWGYNSYEEFLEEVGEEVEPQGTELGDKILPSSEYKKVGNIYMQTPDLSNLNPEATYYVTYDGDTQKIAGRIDRVDEPTNWYNYEEKKWANIVTVTDNQVAYWVWIPKYSYKTDNSTETVDAKFISEEGDIYIDGSGNEIELSGYSVSEAFKFGDTSLPGYWMSKYEVADNALETIGVTGDIENITVTSTAVTTTGTTEDYQIYLDGKLEYTGTLPKKFTGLKKNKIYDVCVVKNGEMLARYQQKVKTVKIDMSTLNPKATYYVTYDENGENMQIANRIDKGKAPKNWYNYAERRWANIVTVTDSDVTYWVWIPRYRYRTYSDSQTVDIEFISTDITNDNSSVYQVPESFTFGGKELPGYWMSKYEVSEIGGKEAIVCAEKEKSIEVTTSSPSGNYKVYLDGEVTYTGTLPYTISNLEENTKYDIFVCQENGEAIGRKEITTKKATDIKVDLSNLDKDNTFYVYWDEDGTEHNDIPISMPAPENWYNYSEKKWANIVTKANDKWAYWVWIPRYEYKTYEKAQFVDIKFISTTKTQPTDGYQIPESFTFGGQPLAGYWMSKYEVSEP